MIMTIRAGVAVQLLLHQEEINDLEGLAHCWHGNVLLSCSRIMHDNVLMWCTAMFKNYNQQCSSVMFWYDAQQCSSMMHDGCAMYFQNAAKGIHNKRLQCFGKNLFHFSTNLFESPALKIKVSSVSRKKKAHLDVKRLLPSVVKKKTWFPRKNGIYSGFVKFIFVICCYWYCDLRTSLVVDWSHLLISYWWVIGSRV